MRDYQMQSLQFMLEQERRPGGMNSHFWVPVRTGTAPKQKPKMYYCPALDQYASPELVFASSAPQTGVHCGGFLCDEMGLGKTVVTLALIMSNQAPMDARSLFIRRRMDELQLAWRQKKGKKSKVFNEVTCQKKALREWARLSQAERTALQSQVVAHTTQQREGDQVMTSEGPKSLSFQHYTERKFRK